MNDPRTTIDQLRIELAAARAAERQAWRLIESTTAGLVIVQAGRLRYVNPALEVLTDYTAAELLAGDALRFIHPDQLAAMQQLQAARQRGQTAPLSYETRFITRHGDERWAEVMVTPTQFEDQPALLGTVTDITERRRTAQVLRDSEERFRVVFERSSVGKSLTAPDGTLLKVNQALAALLGYTIDELQQANLRDVTHPDDVAETQAVIRGLLANERPTYRIEKRYFHKDGHIVWADVSTTLVRDSTGAARNLITSIQDITERKRAEAALRASEERFRAIFDQAAVGMAMVALDGRFRLVNQRLCAICGYTPDHLQTLTFQAITHPDDLTADLAYVDQVLRGDITTYSMEKRYLRADHSIIWINLTVALVRDEAQQPAYFISVIEDISARKQAEDQLRHSREQLRALAAHLESVREEERRWIAREIHDELGQTLTGLKMDVTWLARDLRPDQTAPRAKAQGILNLIDTTIDAMRGLIAQMRPGILDDLGLVAALDWQAQEFQQRTGIECRVELPADDVALEPERAVVIFRICQEALTNVTRHAQATQVTIRLTVAEHALTLRVADNGRGIRPNEVDSPQAFGLIGMRERTLLLGGTVSIAPQVQGGTCVTVSIPIHSN